MLSFWHRLPAIVRALLAGMTVAVVGTTPWALLVSANLEHWPSVPWSVVPTAALLWFYWRYLRGEGWPVDAETDKANAPASVLAFAREALDSGSRL